MKSVVIETANALNRKLPKKVYEIKDNLLPLKVGKYGQIEEWDEDYIEAEPGHRHISHLYGLYPSEIVNESNKELYDAAYKTIIRRLENGRGHTGWPKAWITAMLARLSKGEEAFNSLMEFSANSTSKTRLCLHPPSQIDANFGIAAVISEMFVREVNKKIYLLLAKSS